MRRRNYAGWSDPAVWTVGMLGFASGLPLALTASTLSAWLKDAGVTLAAIGLFAAVGLPYTLKFLWAPFLDGLHLPLLGRRRGWLLVTQLALAGLLVAMAGQNPQTTPWMVALLAFLIAFASASQDIVVDAYRTERLTPEALGPGVAVATFGYRLAMLASGGGALYLADRFGWAPTYQIMAAIMGAFAGYTLLIAEPAVPESATAKRSPREWLTHFVVEPFADFAHRPGWKWVLAFILTYKLGDAFLGVMTNPFLLEIGFAKAEIARIVKLYGFGATLAGSFAAAWAVQRWSLVWLLLAGGLLHALTNLMFLAQAHVGADPTILTLGISLENLTGGFSAGVFVVYISRLCRADYTATQYALLSALAAFARTALSTAAGSLAASIGWEAFFLLCVALALPSLVILARLEQR